MLQGEIVGATGVELVDSQTEPKCPNCHSEGAWRNGFRDGNQLYRCKNRECRRQFGAGEHPSGRRFPYEVMADTVRWYYLGGSLRQAAAKVMDDHSIRDTVIATSTVRSWVQEYTDLAFEKTRVLKANCSDSWILDICPVAMGEPDCWLVTDKASGFILAIDCLYGGVEANAVQMVKKAINNANTPPRILICRLSPVGPLFEDACYGKRIFKALEKKFPRRRD